MYEFRPRPGFGTITRAHAAGLEIAAHRTTGNLAVLILAGQPHFDVMGAPRAKAHVARAKHDRAIGQIERFQNALRTFGHAIQLGAAVLWRGDRHHFDLFKLMLTQHARGILARTSRFRAETLSVRGHALGQFICVQNAARHHIGQGHFRRGHKPPAVGGLIAVFGKFRQLRRAKHRLVPHQNRGPCFGQAILVDMGVQHELRQSAVQPDQRALQNHKARA